MAYTPSPYDTEGDYWTDPTSANSQQAVPESALRSAAPSPAANPALFDDSRVSTGTMTSNSTEDKFFVMVRDEARQALQRVDANWSATGLAMAQAALADYKTRIAAKQSPERAAAGAYEAFKTALAGKTSARPQPASTTGSGEVPGSQVSDADRATALDAIRDNIKDGLDVRKGLLAPRTEGGMPINDPNARDTFTPVNAVPISNAAAGLTAENVSGPRQVTAATSESVGPQRVTNTEAVGAITPERISAAERLKAAEQARTSVEGTTLDTAQADQARTVSDQAIKDLQETAAGRGAGQAAADARARAEVAKLQQSLTGAAFGATGPARKGALIGAQLAAAEQGANAIAARDAKASEERIQAQNTVGQLAQQTRSLDQQQAAKKAEIDQQRKTLQAQLDAAKAANDQDAINSINTKLLELDQQAKALNAAAGNSALESAAGRKQGANTADAAAANLAEGQDKAREQGNRQFNAGETTKVDVGNRDATTAVETTNVGANNDMGKFVAGEENKVAGRNSDQTVAVAQGNNTQGLAANVAGSNQDLAQARLRLEIQESLDKAAQGLLDESGRQSALKLAYAQNARAEETLRMAKTEAERAQANADRAFWTTTITSLLGYVLPGPKAAAAHGGAITRPEQVVVGEGGHTEIIIPVKGHLGERLASMLAVESKPFDADAADASDGAIDSEQDLLDAIKASLKTFHIEHPKPKPREVSEDDVAALMAQSVVRHRKQR